MFIVSIRQKKFGGKFESAGCQEQNILEEISVKNSSFTFLYHFHNSKNNLLCCQPLSGAGFLYLEGGPGTPNCGIGLKLKLFPGLLLVPITLFEEY